MIIVPTDTGVRVGGAAHLVEGTDRLTAWAERHVRRDPQLAWLIGNFVEADNPNGNGHIFALEDLKDAVNTIPSKPLNLLHHENYILGAFAGAEMVYPTGETADSTPMPNPYVEALAVLWKHLFPEEFKMVEKAQKNGNLFFSMEAAPETLTFVDHAGVTVPYMGRQHDSYPTDDVLAKRILNKPHFGGGAIIIPPIQPGWNRADITSLSSFMEKEPDLAESIHAQIATEAPHMTPDQWDSLMLSLVKLAEPIC